MTEPSAEEPAGLPLQRIPGYLIRRAQQVHNALWTAHVPVDVTSPQYAVLATLAARPDLSQVRLGELASLDRSSAADVVARLVDRRWVARERDPRDGRRHRLRLADEATDALRSLTPDAARVQELFLAPLPPDERAPFAGQLRRVARFEAVPADTVPADTDPAPGAPVLDLEVPGHLIRCAQQVHTAIWQRTFGTEITGPQYAILHVLATHAQLGQTELGDLAALDRSTLADLVERLHRRGWLDRERDPADGRGRRIRLTAAAADSMPRFAAGMASVQRELVAPLLPGDREPFTARLATVGGLAVGPSRAYRPYTE